MKAPRHAILILLLCITGHTLAQPPGCTFKEPIAHIDFGRGPEVKDFNTASLSNYDRIYGSCPTDGHYTFTPATYDCFRGDWFTITADHTPGDVNGNMMLVNASPEGGVFLRRTIGGLSGGRNYEVAMWMINVCRLYICCSSLSPKISFVLSTTGGKRLAAYRIGDLPQRTAAQWRKFAGYFTLPAGEKEVVLTLMNSTIGGCGNDFALDDITFRECVPPKPVLAALPKKKSTQPAAPQKAVLKTPVQKVVVTPKSSGKSTSAAIPVKEASKPVPVSTNTLPAPVIKLSTTPPWRFFVPRLQCLPDTYDRLPLRSLTKCWAE